MRAASIVCLFAVLSQGALIAQQSRPATFAVDAVAAFDTTIDETGETMVGIVLDSMLSADLGRGFQGIVRPMVQRLGRTGEWNRQVQVATLRYERPGHIAVRIDGGFIAPPVGLANLSLRPHLNPTIAQPSSLFQSLPSLQPNYPRANLLGGLYPLGAVATLSGGLWDARMGVIDSSPIRVRRVFASLNPPRLANIVIGGGMTPMVGLRVGASVTRGGWLRAGESAGVTTDRAATVWTIESEFSFRHSKVMGEWTRDTVETDSGDRVASGWFIQGQQTLAPRWFAAGRIERMSSPQYVGTALPSQGINPAVSLRDRQFTGVEETLGYRLTPDLTLRASHRVRRGFGATLFDHQVAVSMVWARRWM